MKLSLHRSKHSNDNKQDEQKILSDYERDLQTVIGIFAEVLGKNASDIGPDDDFFTDLGGDSLISLQACVEAEKAFGIDISETSYANCRTAADLTKLIHSVKNGTPEDTEEEVSEVIRPITNFEDTPEYAAFVARIKEAGANNPYFAVHDSALRDTSLLDGREVLNFSSYNYAGMSGRRETVEAAKQAADHYGTSASGSRLLGGEKPIHRQLEEAIAKWKHTEDAVVLVGGHSTNVTFVGNFCVKGDLIIYDVLAHNSITEGCRLSEADSRPFPHNDFKSLETILGNVRDRYRKVLIVVEGVYSMDGDIAPIPEYVRIKKQFGCFLMVDEAHSACVLGKKGAGVDEYFSLEPNDIDIKMGTLSKGLGTCGGYIAAKHSIVSYLRYSLPGFVFSVGMSPVLAAASLKAIELLETDPSILENLRRNISVFVSEAHKRHFNTCLAGESAIIPILVGDDESAYLLSTALRKKGVFVPPAVYPAVPRNKSRLRFCVISEHTPEQIVFALDKLVEACTELGIKLPE